jgi:glyoxylase I family protein
MVSAGAAFVNEIRLDDGSHLVMLRDPWGMALQLCNRADALLRTD